MNLPKLRIGELEAAIPIIQGGMAVRISLAPLAAAVANEGGIGLIAASGMRVPELVRHIREARELSDGIIGINVMVAVKEFASLVKAAIQERVDIVVAGAGFSRDVFKWCREAKVAIAPIVSSVRVAKLAEMFGADAVILEGKEAGGHLGTSESTWSLLPRIVEAVKIPVVAAGGILNGRDIFRAITGGASGVQMGTRFAVSEESSAAQAWKEACVKAKPEDVVIIESPVGMPGRALFSKFVKKLYAGEIPHHEDIGRCVTCLKECKKNYCIIEALVRAQRGDMERGLIFCGERVGEIKEILSVKEIIKRLVDEYILAASGVTAFA
ncbi:MAG: nitronate monooxygenase [Actinobacteria bacterium]|nr:nitronate monooxygenase [Actinomycetota bacterium]